MSYFEDRYHDVVNTGGFSHQPVHGTSPSSGMMVGLHGDHGGVEHIVPRSEFAPKHIHDHYQQTKHLYNDPDVHQGGWHNPDDDKVYLDVSKRHQSHDEAIEASHKNKQLAYFDAGTGDVHSVPGARTAKRGNSGAQNSPQGREGNPRQGQGEVQVRPGQGQQAPRKTRDVLEHPAVKKDLRSLDPKIRQKAVDIMEGLAQGKEYPTTHALNGPLKGWHATRVNQQYRVTHRYDGDDLMVAHVGPHDYDKAAQRVAERDPAYIRQEEFGKTIQPRMFANKEEAHGHAVALLHSAGHPRAEDLVTMVGNVGHSSAFHHEGAPGIMFNHNHLNSHVVAHEVAHLIRQHEDGTEESGHGPEFEKTFYSLVGQHKEAFTPTKRVFTHTDGLDHRLWKGETIRPEVRQHVLDEIKSFWQPLYGDGWQKWARIYFAGSEASEWTSSTLEGNNDFDTLVGINYHVMRDEVASVEDLSDQEIADKLNAEFKLLNNPAEFIEVDGVKTGPWDHTWYVNLKGWDIRLIKPYAAYELVADKWWVKPAHLPHWSLKDFPETVLAELKSVDKYVRAVLNLPEPIRTQQGSSLFTHLHSDRSRAFSDRGEGWYDPANLIEKWLDQAGLWAELVSCKHRWDAGYGKPPVSWDNNHPYGKTAGYAEYMSKPHYDTADRVEASDPDRAKRLRELGDSDKDYYGRRKGFSPGEQVMNGKSPSLAGWVKTKDLLPYAVHHGDQHGKSREVVDSIKEDLQGGKGMSSPIDLHYHPGSHSAKIEGNHRLQAAHEAGWEHVPVMVSVDHEPRMAHDGDHSVPAKFPKKELKSNDTWLHPSHVLPDSMMHPNEKSHPLRAQAAQYTVRVEHGHQSQDSHHLEHGGPKHTTHVQVHVDDDKPEWDADREAEMTAAQMVKARGFMPTKTDIVHLEAALLKIRPLKIAAAAAIRKLADDDDDDLLARLKAKPKEKGDHHPAYPPDGTQNEPHGWEGERTKANSQKYTYQTGLMKKHNIVQDPDYEDPPVIKAQFRHGRGMPLKDFQPSEVLHTFQPLLDMSVVNEYKKNGHTAPAEHSGALDEDTRDKNYHPHIHTINGKNLLVDGHHRTMAARLSGKAIKAYHFDHDKHPEIAQTPEEAHAEHKKIMQA